jgi:hypothetical protein
MSNTLKFGNGEWYGKEGTILAYNDENNNYKPLPFTFDRDSVATRVNKQGLIETVGADQPRIDYLNDSNGALLLEPSRTNYLLQSNQFDTTWTLSASIDLTSGQSGVYGSNDAWLLKRNSTGSRYIQQSLSLSSAQYSYSVYLKAESTNWAFLWSYDGGVTSVNAYFDLENGVVGQIGGDALDGTNIESVGNGWYRCTLIYTQPPALIRIYPANSNGNISTGTDNGIYIQHAQLEVGSYESSIINTTSAAVTRLADGCSQTPPDGVIGQTEGSIFIELDINSRVLSSSWAFSLNDGTTSNYIGLRRSGGAEFFVHINVSGTTNALIATGITNGKNKISIGYASNDIIVYVNGVNVGVDTSSNIPTTSDLQIGNLISNRILEDAVYGFKLYNTRLSNSELAALTQV